ncbi:MAG: bifunctional nuclease family protein [Thermosynechococcaceae cyanobacterium]
MIEMHVAGIALDASSRLPIVLLKDGTGRRALPIWIGQTEARSILSALENQRPQRPMTHDLMANCFMEWELEITRVVIHSLEDSTYYAVLTMEQGGITKEIDARPSDAIALALRMDTPIWVLEEVVAEASMPVDQEADDQEQEEFREFLENIQPGDFTKSLEGGEANG